MAEKISLLKNKRIILAVTGSIAVYKAIDLASKLTQTGAQVDVIMTEASMRFVTPLTFQSVTGRAVYTNLWESSQGGLPTHIAHIGLGEGADLMIVAPATANTIAKLAHGFADDLLTVTALALRCPLAVAPAMDGGMYEHIASQTNRQILIERGVHWIEPEEGRFASGLAGKGRLPETPTLLGHIRRIIGKQGALAGKKLVVTAGGTREAIDPVRYISNHSSGKQGYAIAQAALDAGAEVVLISTVSSLTVPTGCEFVAVDSAQEMLTQVLNHTQKADVLVMAAAVADFRPATIAEQKIKKSPDDDSAPTVVLTRNPDILLEVKQQREKLGYPQVTVGFAAESQHLLEHASSKLQRKGLDLLVANDITAHDAGFAVDTNRVVLLNADGSQKALDLMSKAKVGEVLVEEIAIKLSSANL